MKLALGRLGSAGTRTLIQRAIASLRARGTDAHLWLPGGDVKTYGPELVVNGDFSNGTTGWTTIQAGWTVAAGVASVTSSVAGSTYIRQGLTVAGKSYRITATITTITSGIVYLTAGNALSSEITQSGTYSYTVTANDSTGFGVYAQSTTAVASFDNISVREITSITPTITSGLTTGNYLESTGNTLATVDNPCGLVLDALGTVGVELVTNGGPFVNTTGWSVARATTSIASSALRVTATAAYANANYSIATVAGRRYKVVLNLVSVSAAKSIGLYIGTNSFTADLASLVIGSVAGRFQITFTASGATSYIFTQDVGAFVAGDYYEFDNISVREVSGIHLTQGTTANKPVLRRGALNLLTYSQDFTQWSPGNITLSDSGEISPIGVNYTKFLTATTGATICGRAAAVNSSAATYTVYVKRGSGATDANNFTLYNSTTSQYLVRSALNFDSGIVTNLVGSMVATRISATEYRLTLTSSTGITAGNVLSVYIGHIGSSSTAGMYVLATGAQLETGSTASAYSPTTTAAASNPDAGKYSWSFDGSNDSLALGSVPFQMGDDHCVIAGFKATDNGIHKTVFVCENGSARVAQMRVTANLLMAVWQDSGASVLYSSPLSVSESVVGACRQIGTTLALRKNGVQVDTGTRPAGSTTMTAANIGVGLTTEIFTGTIGPIIAIKGTVTDAELLMYERLIAALTPNGPVF